MSVFDDLIDRRGTGSLKWEHFDSETVIPMWVADMDFAVPPAVVEALRRRVNHGVFGYTLPPASLVDVVLGYLQEQYGWNIQAEWLVWLPGVVPGLNVATRAFSKPGESVLLATPTYPPILEAPLLAGRERVTVPFSNECGRWELAVEELEAQVQPGTRLFMFCNPHNPVGRVFTRPELEQVAQFCLSHDLMICSDEIHCDLILDDLPHIPIASLSPEIADRSITFMSPSKTFNIAGLNCAFAVIPDRELRRQFVAAKGGLVPYPNALGYAACEAAYAHGESWRQELLTYLRGNRDLVEGFVAEKLAGLSMSHVEATYLAWIDTREAGISHPVQFFERRGVGLSDGRHFGADGFVRLNFACPRARLQEALERMGGSVLEPVHQKQHNLGTK